MSDKNQAFIAVGDIHGCAKTLEALLEKIAPFEDRTFVFIGDYIDRGPNSRRVVDLLLDFSKKRECVMLRGNHEQMMIDAHDRGDVQLWLMNGGESTLHSYGAPFNKLELPSQHYHFYRNTKLYYDTPEYFFVHAGIPPDMTVEEAINARDMEESFLWSRAHLDAYGNIWEKKVVFGHTPKPEPLVKDNMIDIDTGCVYSHMGMYHKMTAVKLPEEEFIFQENLD